MHTELLPALLWRSMAQKAAASSPCRTKRAKVGNFAPNLIKLLKRQSFPLFSFCPSWWVWMGNARASPVFRKAETSCVGTDDSLVYAEGFPLWAVYSRVARPHRAWSVMPSSSQPLDASPFQRSNCLPVFTWGKPKQSKVVDLPRPEGSRVHQGVRVMLPLSSS